VLTFVCGETFSPSTSTYASSCYADAMPNSGMHQLPSCLTKAFVYFLYREEADSKKKAILIKIVFSVQQVEGSIPRCSHSQS